MSFSTSCVFYFLCESLAIVTREHGDLFLTNFGDAAVRMMNLPVSLSLDGLPF